MKVGYSLVDFVLNNYSQKSLFAKYFRLSETAINYCLKDTSNKVNNPLRKDYDPSLAFMYRGDGRLVSKDWADDSYTGDIFDLIAVLSGLSVTKPKEFTDICKILINKNELSDETINRNVKIIESKSFKLIRFKERPLYSRDIKYLSGGGINIEHFKNSNNYAAQNIWIGDSVTPIYTHKTNDPAYVYHLGFNNDNPILQIYRPFNKSKINKFKTNSRTLFQAERELYIADTLIITKSRKDKLAIESMLIDNDSCYVSDIEVGASFFIISAFNTKHIPETNTKYCVTSFSSENKRLDVNTYNLLKRYYNNIIIFVDYDKEGIKNAFYHNVLFNIKSSLPFA